MIIMRHVWLSSILRLFFFNDTPPTEIYTLSLHDALPIFTAGTYGDDAKLLTPSKQGVASGDPPPLAQQPKYPHSPGVYAEWIAACKGGSPAGSTFDGHAGGLSSMVLLGCLAVRLGRPLEVNPENGKVPNVAIPDEYS